MGKKILIVDDDDALSGALNTKFSNIGYEVALARDGEEAITSLDQNVFDVIITDLHMPNKDGFEVLKKAKETKNADVPIYVITNLGSDKFCDHATELGAKKCFVKSLVTLRDVVSAIDNELS